jgi:hypothetical protein
MAHNPEDRASTEQQNEERRGTPTPAPAGGPGGTLAVLKRTPGLKAQQAIVAPTRHGETTGPAGLGGGEHQDGGYAEHAAHAAHKAHAVGEGLKEAAPEVKEAADFAKHQAAARATLDTDARMTHDLRLMRRNLRSVESQLKNGGGAKATAKLAEARTALEVAAAEGATVHASVADANQLLRKYERAKAGARGAAMARLGGAAAALEASLQASQVGRGLLAAGRVVSSKAFVNGLMAVGAAMDTVAAHQDSPNTTTGGRAANAALAGGGGALVMAHPAVGVADALVPEDYKLSQVYRGGAAALSAIGEGVVTGDTRGMDAVHERSKAGEYGKVMKTASEAGDYWAEKGITGGLAEFADAVTWWLSR